MRTVLAEPDRVLKTNMKKILLTSVLWLLAACNGSSAHDKLIKLLKTTHSWTATTQMLGEAWAQGTVRDRYAQETLKKSQTEIAKATQDLTPPPLVPELQQTIQEITINIEQHNKTALVSSLHKLSIQQQQLETLAQAEGVHL